LKTSVIGYGVDEAMDSEEDDLVFVCSSKSVKKRMLQSLAKYSYDKDMNFATYVASPEDLDKNIAGTLVEFVED
jgi:hypothetical protein